MITIYGMQSPSVAKVRAALLQKGLEFQHVSVNIGNKSEEFKKLTPVDKIPVLEDDDGTVVWDSTHIIGYLDAKYPETYRMMGKDAKTRAKILNIISLVNRIEEVLPPFFYEKFDMVDAGIKKGESHRARIYNDQQKADALKDISYRLKRLEEIRSDQKFFTGEFSTADAAVLSTLGTLQFIGLDIGSWKEWQADLMKDENIAKMFPSKEEKAIKEI